MIEITTIMGDLSFELFTDADKARLVEAFGAKMQKAMQDRVDRGETIDGDAFAPYAPSTLKFKAGAGLVQKRGKNKGSSKWFHMTGTMMESMAYEADANAMEATVFMRGTHEAFTVRSQSAKKSRKPAPKAGTGSKPYNAQIAMYLHEGTTKMQPRPWIGLNEEEYDSIIEDGLKAAGFEEV